MLSWRWFAARIGGAVVTLVGVTVVVFVVLRTIPGNAITAALGIESGTLTTQQKAALAHFYGIDKPWIAQLCTWVSGVATGELGISLTSGKTVSSLLGTALPVTVELAVMAAVMGSAAGLLIPIVTLTGIQFGYLLGGTIIVEQIFALPGVGRLLFTSISNRDYPVVQVTVLVIAVLVVLVNLVVDLLYRVIDPRTRTA